MSYTPRLLIQHNDLKKIVSELENEQYSSSKNKKEVAKFLLRELRERKLILSFDKPKVMLASSEFTSFYTWVRNRLDQGNIYYITFI